MLLGRSCRGRSTVHRPPLVHTFGRHVRGSRACGTLVSGRFRAIRPDRSPTRLGLRLMGWRPVDPWSVEEAGVSAFDLLSADSLGLLAL